MYIMKDEFASGYLYSTILSLGTTVLVHCFQVGRLWGFISGTTLILCFLRRWFDCFDSNLRTGSSQKRRVCDDGAM